MVNPNVNSYEFATSTTYKNVVEKFVTIALS